MSSIRNYKIDNDPVAERRDERALRNFKSVLKELTHLLMQSTRSETASLYWVNKDRQQFVLESASSRIQKATFQDRVLFENSWMDAYKDLSEPVQLEVGTHVDASELTHYVSAEVAPVRYLNVLPFMNKGETVAITVLESNSSNVTPDDESAVLSYTNALGNLLYTFLELSDLSADESQWGQYDEMLNQVNSREDHAILLDNVATQLLSFTHKGGVSVLCRGADGWRVVMHAAYSTGAPAIGSIMQENTISYNALKSGGPEFSIHFNGNPRRVCASEPLSQGATLAVPLLLHDRRQAVYVVYDENPLLFKESLKHKMANLVRIASLKMMAAKESYKVSSDFMTNDTGAFNASLIERTLYNQLKRARLMPNEHSWAVMFSCEEINTLRTRFGLDDLKHLQKQIVSRSTYCGENTSSIIGFHADYIYLAVVQSSKEDGIEEWLRHISSQQDKSFSCGADNINLNFRSGITKLGPAHQDIFSITKSIKKAFSDANREAAFSKEV
ncbi:MAG: hypothetical protein JJU41_09125 [Bacteroidetes bacterium]|nr:hypothetical protein [Bacteroidota bacterium]